MTNKDQSQSYQFNDKVEAQFIGGIHYHGVALKLNPPNNVPSPTARYFVGREKALEDLQQLVQSNKTVSISAIQGMGGIGKTELAKYYAIVYQNDYPDGIAWFNFGTVGIAEEIVSFGRNVLKLSFPEDAPIGEKVAQVWQDWPVEKGALVIIDNVNRKEDYEEIKPYLPTGTGFKVVITSRVKFSNIPAYSVSRTHEVHLGGQQPSQSETTKPQGDRKTSRRSQNLKAITKLRGDREGDCSRRKELL